MSYGIVAVNKTLFIRAVRRQKHAMSETVFTNPRTIYPDFSVELRQAVKRAGLFENLAYVFDIVFLVLAATLAKPAWLVLVPVLAIAWDLILPVYKKKYVVPLKLVTRKYFQEHKTEAVIYLSGIDGLEFHLDQWIPTLRELDLKKTVILRNRSYYEYGTSLDIPALVIGSYNGLYDFLTGREKIVFYVNNDVKNLQMLESSHPAHVLLLHGESEKRPSFSRASLIYDFLFVAGKAAIDRYKKAGIKIPAEKFRVVGRPQLGILSNTKIKESAAHRKTVLYAPTFEGAREDENYSSVEKFGLRIVEEIVRNGSYRLVVKLHPKTGYFSGKYAGIVQRMREMLMKRGHDGHIWIDPYKPEMTLYDCFIESDILISDVSSVPIDYLVLNRPIIATNPFAIDIKKGAALYPFWKGCYILNSNSNVLELIHTALSSDPKRDERERIARYYLGEAVFTDESMTKRFCDTVDVIVKHTETKNGSQLRK